jgi:hypothetical protein
MICGCGPGVIVVQVAPPLVVDSNLPLLVRSQPCVGEIMLSWRGRKLRQSARAAFTLARGPRVLSIRPSDAIAVTHADPAMADCSVCPGLSDPSFFTILSGLQVRPPSSVANSTAAEFTPSPV